MKTMIRCLTLALVSIAFCEATDKFTDEFHVVVGLRKNGLAELEKTFWEVSDPTSKRYLDFQSREELARLIGASEEDITAVSSWLVTLGGRDVAISALNDTITATFTTDVVDTVRRTSTGGGVDGVDGVESLWSPRGLPSLSATKSPVHDAVRYLLRRDNKAPNLQSAPRPKGQSSLMNSSDDSRGTVSNQKKAYGIPETLQATNPNTLQMVWGPGTFGYNADDLGIFQDYYVPKLNLKKITCNGKNDCDNNGDNFGEGSLDTEYISSMGLGVRTLVMNTNKSSSTEEGNGFGQALLDFIVDLSSAKEVPQVLSLSLGSLSAYSCDLLCSEAEKTGTNRLVCEAYLQNQRQVCMYLSKEQSDAINHAFQVLGLRGVSIFGSSGDGGSHFSFGPFQTGLLANKLNKIACEFQLPVFPTGSQYITSVGGTAWGGAGGSKNPKAWSGSGGGFAWQFPAPAHQKDVVAKYLENALGLPPSSSYNASGRGYPDISSLADVVIPLCVYGGCSDSGGTSASSPATAGLFSMITDHRLNNNLKPLGFVAPRIWQVASQFPGEAFQDVISGNTKTTCKNGFPARKGWDPVTGWGRPVWDGMVKHFGSDSGLGK